MGSFFRALVVLVALLVAFAALVRWRFGGGERLEDRTGTPALPGSALEVVADLELPPGNLAVSGTGRVFFTFHPEGNPPVQVAELKDRQPVAYPNERFQKPTPGPGEGPHFQSALALRIDAQDRLWVLDYAHHGFGTPRLLAFDLKTDALVHQYDFPRSVAGLLSMMNDFQVSPDGKRIYLADASVFRQTPAIVVYDVEHGNSRRVLEGDPSVTAKNYVIGAPGRDMTLFGVFTLKIGIDSIALDPKGEWLYYGPVSDGQLYRVATRDLDDASLAPDALAAKVESWGPKPLSDGITMDRDGTVYLSDMEHSAIVMLGPDKKLTTLVEDEKLRWPDGFSFGPDGWLYVTCSALHQVILKGAGEVAEHAPYQIFRLKSGHPGVPGH